MGLFNRTANSTANATLNPETGPLKLTVTEAFTAVLTTAMAADGYATEEELRLMRDDLFSMQLFKALDEEERLHMLDRVLKLVQTPGPEVLLTSAPALLSPELRETAFAMAADIVTSDGSIAVEETAYLEQLQAALEIPTELAELLIKAMTIKNRG